MMHRAVPLHYFQVVFHEYQAAAGKHPPVFQGFPAILNYFAAFGFSTIAVSGNGPLKSVT